MYDDEQSVVLEFKVKRNKMVLVFFGVAKERKVQLLFRHCEAVLMCDMCLGYVVRLCLVHGSSVRRLLLTHTCQAFVR